MNRRLAISGVILLTVGLALTAFAGLVSAGGLAQRNGAPAADTVAPTITVSLDTSLSTENVVVTVVTDEEIRTLEPELSLFVSTSDDPDNVGTINARLLGVNIPRASKTPGENKWTFTLSIALANKYSVVVAAEDADRNRGIAGVEAWPGNPNAITFEIDNALPGEAGERPAEGNFDTEADPFFIEIVWLSEDGEYTGDSHDSVDLAKAVLDEGTDDERDLIAEGVASTRGGRRWTLSVSDIGLGAHTLTYNGADDAGNVLAADAVLSFTVVEGPKFELALTPGMNLVSLPLDPEDTDINAVLGDNLFLDLVFTKGKKRWLVAIIDPTTGLLTGSLTTIDGRHAYWMRAAATVTLRMDIPPLGAPELPPRIKVEKNRWSFVSVMSLRDIETIPQGSTWDADEVFGSNWTIAWTYDRGQWQAVLPSGFAGDRICENPDQGGNGVLDGGLDEGPCGHEDPFFPGEFFTVDLLQGGSDGVHTGRGYLVWFVKRDFLVPH